MVDAAPTVLVSSHALEQATVRVAPWPRWMLRSWLVAEVVAAVAAGRYAKRRPTAFLRAGGTRRVAGPGDGRVRVVWTSNLSHALIVRRRRIDDRRGWVVITVLERGDRG